MIEISKASKNKYLHSQGIMREKKICYIIIIIIVIIIIS